jgi:hypothetical protein
MAVCDDGDVFPADADGMKRPCGLGGRGRIGEQCESEGMGHGRYLTLTVRKTTDRWLRSYLRNGANER